MERKDQFLASALRAVLLLLVVWMVKGLLVPVALGGLFALILHPLQRRLALRLGKFGNQTPLLLTIGAFVLVVIPFALIAAQVVKSVNDFLSEDLTGALNALQAFTEDHLAWLGERLNLKVGSLREQLGSVVQQIGSAVAGFASSFAQSLPGQIIDVFLFALALYYFLRDGSAFLRFMLRLSPFHNDDVDELFASIQETVYGAIVGQLATSAVQGALTTATLFIFRIPGALLFGIIATILSVLPMVGTTPVTIGAAIYLFAVSRPGAAVGMLIAAAVIGISDNVVRPWMQSSQTKMHPLLILLGIFGGIDFFGPAGVFLGPVVVAMGLWTVDTYATLQSKRTAIEATAKSRPPPAGSL